MECREIRDLADSFLSEQLQVETNHEVLRHLEDCPACRAELASQRELRTTIRRAFMNSEALRISDEFCGRALYQVRQAARQKAPHRIVSRRWAIGFTVAASMAIAAGVGEFFRTRGIDLVARDAIGDHQNCAVRFRLAEKPISLEDASARYDPSYRLLQDTPSDNWNAPIGPMHVVDRHSCEFQGRRFAHIVLQFQGQIVSLLITARDGRVIESLGGTDRVPHPVALGSNEEFRVVSFEIPGHIVFLVGGLEEQQLRQVAQSVSGPLYNRFAKG